MAKSRGECLPQRLFELFLFTAFLISPIGFDSLTCHLPSFIVFVTPLHLFLIKSSVSTLNSWNKLFCLHIFLLNLNTSAQHFEADLLQNQYDILLKNSMHEISEWPTGTICKSHISYVCHNSYSFTSHITPANTHLCFFQLWTTSLSLPDQSL